MHTPPNTPRNTTKIHSEAFADLLEKINVIITMLNLSSNGVVILYNSIEEHPLAIISLYNSCKEIIETKSEFEKNEIFKQIRDHILKYKNLEAFGFIN